jgi:hypothetical protein
LGDGRLVQFAYAKLVASAPISCAVCCAVNSAANGPCQKRRRRFSIVRLDAEFVPLARGADLLGRAFSYRAGRWSDDVGEQC